MKGEDGEIVMVVDLYLILTLLQHKKSGPLLSPYISTTKIFASNIHPIHTRIHYLPSLCNSAFGFLVFIFYFFVFLFFFHIYIYIYIYIFFFLLILILIFFIIFENQMTSVGSSLFN